MSGGRLTELIASRNRQRRRWSQPAGPPRPEVLRTMAADPTVPLPVLSQLLRRGRPLDSAGLAETAARHLRAEASGLGIVDRLLTDADVSEIMINGVGRIWIERRGRLVPVEHTLTANGLSLIIERMLSPLGLRLDRLHPIVDARLPDGSRVNVVARPLAVDGPLVSIRRFSADRLPLSAFGPDDLTRRLVGLVQDRRSILVVGPTSSGKTTLLNSLSEHIGVAERVVTIEDTAELRLAGSHIVRLEARPANSEGVGEIPLRRLVITALRLRPDRLVVGEVRGAEAFDLLLALTAGHDGSLCTCHASDAASGLRRLEMLASLAGADLAPALLRRYVGDAIDVVITLDRCDGQRAVVAVDEVVSPTEPAAAEWTLRPLWSR